MISRNNVIGVMRMTNAGKSRTQRTLVRRLPAFDTTDTVDKVCSSAIFKKLYWFQQNGQKIERWYLCLNFTVQSSQFNCVRMISLQFCTCRILMQEWTVYGKSEWAELNSTLFSHKCLVSLYFTIRFSAEWTMNLASLSLNEVRKIQQGRPTFISSVSDSQTLYSLRRSKKWVMQWTATACKYFCTQLFCTRPLYLSVCLWWQPMKWSNL